MQMEPTKVKVSAGSFHKIDVMEQPCLGSSGPAALLVCSYKQQRLMGEAVLFQHRVWSRKPGCTSLEEELGPGAAEKSLEWFKTYPVDPRALSGHSV